MTLDKNIEWVRTVKAWTPDKTPVNPQSKIGHWIIIDDCEFFIAKCSECGEIVDSRMISKYPYCHCGAKMETEIKKSCSNCKYWLLDKDDKDRKCRYCFEMDEWELVDQQESEVKGKG